MSNLIYSYPYDSTFNPSMPVIPVEFSYGDQRVTIPALVDSGSDATMVPVSILKRVGARRGDERRVVGVAGFSYITLSYRVQIKFADIEMGVTVIGDTHGNQVLLGRDVLNQLELTLNGLAGMSEIQTSN